MSDGQVSVGADGVGVGDEGDEQAPAATASQARPTTAKGALR